jgi:DNA gyrase subunit A
VKLFDVSDNEHIVSAVRLDEQPDPENEAEEAVTEEMAGRTTEQVPPQTEQARDDLDEDDA